MKRTSLITIFYTVALFVLFTTVALSFPAAAQSSSAEATKVDVVAVTRQYVINRLVVPASVTTRNLSQMSFGTAGRLASFDYDVGDTVPRGTVLATLDPRQIDASIESLKAQREAAEARLTDEQQQLTELQALAKTDFVAQGELRRTRADVAVAEAELAQAKASLNERQVDRDYHELIAPFDAIVVERLVNIGEWVNEDQAAFGLVQRDQMRVGAYLAQRYFGQLNNAAKVAVRSNGQSYTAKIVSKVPYMNPSDRTFLVRLELQDNTALTVGAAVDAVIELRSDQRQLTVPQDAVIRYSDGRTAVWIVDEGDGELRAREILVGLGESFNGWVAIDGELTDSLAEGTDVIVRGNESLTSGDVLQPQTSTDYEVQQ